jgi:hypothetical protein
MNAKQLINSIKRVCRDNYVKPEDVTINYRYSNNDDVWCVKRVRDGSDSGHVYLEPLNARRADGITGQQMINRILGHCYKHNNRPDAIQVRFRYFSPSGGLTSGLTEAGFAVRAVEEDLFDAESNSVLETLCLLTRTGECATL